MAMWNGDKQNMPKLSRPQILHDCGRNIVKKLFFVKDVDSIEGYSNDIINKHFSGSVILTDEKLINVKSVLVDMLSIKDGPSVTRCKLLYQASGSICEKDFHSACVGVENTLVIVKDTSGNIFGGFSDAALERDNIKAAPNAFLFSLVKNKEFNPIKHMGKNGSAIMCDTSALLVFSNMEGQYYDLCLRLPLSSRGSYIQVGQCFEEQSQGLYRRFMPFEIKDMEVYRINFTSSASSKTSEHFEHDTVLGKRKTADELETELRTAQLELLQSIKKVCEEQKFIAKFLSVSVPPTTANDANNMTEFQLILHEIQMIDKLLTAGNDQTRDISDAAVSSIVYINAGGRKIATTKSTLLQAPSGSILANMICDVWGHDLDREGNIIQDVNPELFTAIINHLRLKALLFDTEVPPITVYEEQKTVLDNLLAFYGMENVPVKLIARSPIVYKSL